MHWYEPGMLMHFCSQRAAPVKHSLMSEVEENRIMMKSGVGSKILQLKAVSGEKLEIEKYSASWMVRWLCYKRCVLHVLFRLSIIFAHFKPSFSLHHGPFISANSPSHRRPSDASLNPGLHLQVKDPIVFSHSAERSQTCPANFSHSSTSTQLLVWIS